MSLYFRKAFKAILEVKEILDNNKNSSNDSLFEFLEWELSSFINRISDEAFNKNVLDFFRSPHLKEDFEKLISYFEERKGDFLKKQVFVVFGRNKEYFKTVKNCIKRRGFKCDWLAIENTKGGTKIIFPTLIEKISSSFKIIVIFSADDIGKLKGSKEKFTLRPRLNVVLETGLSFGILREDNVLLLWDEKISNRELISDLGGCFTININKTNKWKEDLKEKLKEFAKEWESGLIY